MKKLLLAFDGAGFSEGAFEFVRRLNESEPLLVTGVFLPEVKYANLWTYAAAAGTGTGAVYLPALEEEDSEVFRENIRHFEELCGRYHIKYRVHNDTGDFTLPELNRESRFADLMVLAGELLHAEDIAGTHFEYLKDVLHEVECPAIVVPEHHQFPGNNILAYDGSAESVYAIKQFAYLFPEFAKNPTLIVYVQEKEHKDIPWRNYITELTTQHYPDLTFYKLELDPQAYFSTWICGREGAILVSGSFSRSPISQIFKRSFVADIIRQHSAPVFIAHR